MRITNAIVGGGAGRPRAQAAGAARLKAAVAVVGVLLAGLLLAAPAFAARPDARRSARVAERPDGKAGPRSGGYVVDPEGCPEEFQRTPDNQQRMETAAAG